MGDVAAKMMACWPRAITARPVVCCATRLMVADLGEIKLTWLTQGVGVTAYAPDTRLIWATCGCRMIVGVAGVLSTNVQEAATYATRWATAKLRLCQD